MQNPIVPQGTVNWGDYTFYSYNLDSELSVPKAIDSLSDSLDFLGVYVISLPYKGNQHPIYIGQGKIGDRIREHKDCLGQIQVSVDRIDTYSVSDQSMREITEENLIGKLNPPLNSHHRTAQADSVIVEIIPDKKDFDIGN